MSVSALPTRSLGAQGSILYYLIDETSLRFPNGQDRSHSMSKPITLQLDARPINLTQALKLASIVMHGGEAKALIAEGLVRVNGSPETRKRRKMVVGDRIDIEGAPSLILVGTSPPAQENVEEPGEH